MTYCQSITKILKIIWDRCIPLSLRSKTRRRASPLLPTWIYSCQSRVTVSCSLPFTTKRDDFNFHNTNFPFLSSNIPSSQAYGFLSHSSYGMPGLAPLMNALFLKAARLSFKLLGQGYVTERLKSSLRKFYGRYGDLIKHYAVSLSQMLHDILGHDHIQMHPQLIRYYTSLRPYYRTWLYYRFWPYVGPYPVSSLQIYTFVVLHSWRVRLAKQETLTPPGHLVSPLVCRGPWMSTVVLYCWCHSDSASVLLYFTYYPNFGGFHRTLHRVRLANRGRLLRTPGPVAFGTCICSNVETILSWTCHVYGPSEFRTSLVTSILLSKETVLKIRNNAQICVIRHYHDYGQYTKVHIEEIGKLQ